MPYLSRFNLIRAIAAILLITITASAADKLPVTELAPLTQPVTSFGAATADGYLYIFGGHLGMPHEYTADLQANKLLRLNLTKPGNWETVAEGPRRVGLALVSYRGQLYRIGGWEAKKADGEKWNLYSTPDFARFDSKSSQWQDLATLPHGRSSHDAALVGSNLYVVGGWELKGAGESEWHETAYVCDLADANPQWREIAKPPFRRRALAVAGFAGKLYVIGGMDDTNETTTAVNIFDPQSNQWSKGPAIPGEKADGFGISAFGTPDGLFASCRTGALLRLNADQKAWTTVGKLNHPRYFHRLVAADDGRLLVVGGISSGKKVAEVELLDIKETAK